MRKQENHTKGHLPGAKRPATGTGEWAATNVNIQKGCEHGCKYCYAACMAIRFKRATPESWSVPVMLQGKLAKRYSRRSGRIMFPTTHDITPANVNACAAVLGKMLRASNDVLIVSKPHIECIERLCSELNSYRNQVTFRFTMGSTADATLKYWEPEAPTFHKRLACLEHAYGAGFQTSVSCEPMLDGAPDRLIEECRPFVTDAIWLGRANRLMATLAVTRPGDRDARQHARDLMVLHSNEWIRRLYERFQNDPLIKWKDSIKEVVGLTRPTEKGLDI